MDVTGLQGLLAELELEKGLTQQEAERLRGRWRELPSDMRAALAMEVVLGAQAGVHDTYLIALRLARELEELRKEMEELRELLRERGTEGSRADQRELVGPDSSP